MSTTWAVILSLGLLAGNAFFVAAEFALVASKRYRLEHAAAGGSRGARAALYGTRELSVMLAGAQLGITLCSLGLGALAEPALDHLLQPALHAVGLPDLPSEIAAFLLALLIVTFLHLVIGEMTPKSWAITDPERSATLLALPFRAFTRVVRPALTALNGLANAALRPFGVHPQDQLAQAHGPQEMHILLERSRAEGLIGAEQTELLTSMLKLQQTRVGDVLVPAGRLVTVAPAATAADIEEASRRSGRSRLAVVTGPLVGGAGPLVGGAGPSVGGAGTSVGGEGTSLGGAGTSVGGAGGSVGAAGPLVGGVGMSVVGVVHVREALRATTAGRDTTAGALMDPPFVLQATVTVTDAVTAMRAGRAQLAMVLRDGRPAGFVALEDLLELVIGEFDDETDPIPVGRRMR